MKPGRSGDHGHHIGTCPLCNGRIRRKDRVRHVRAVFRAAEQPEVVSSGA